MSSESLFKRAAAIRSRAFTAMDIAAPGLEIAACTQCAQK
jgi:hypothetical protein